MDTNDRLPADITTMEIDGNLPVIEFARALAKGGLALQFNARTNKLRIVQKTVSTPALRTRTDILNEALCKQREHVQRHRAARAEA